MGTEYTIKIGKTSWTYINYYRFSKQNKYIDQELYGLFLSSCPFLYSEPLYKNKHDLLDTGIEVQ